jgi:hypothetical protein
MVSSISHHSVIGDSDCQQHEHQTDLLCISQKRVEIIQEIQDRYA